MWSIFIPTGVEPIVTTGVQHLVTELQESLSQYGFFLQMKESRLGDGAYIFDSDIADIVFHYYNSYVPLQIISKKGLKRMQENIFNLQ